MRSFRASGSKEHFLNCRMPVNRNLAFLTPEERKRGQENAMVTNSARLNARFNKPEDPEMRGRFLKRLQQELDKED